MTRGFTPPDGLEQAILNVLNNAADASPLPRIQRVRTPDALLIDIADRGPGFTPEQKALAGRAPLRPASRDGLGWALRSPTPRWSALAAALP